MGEWRNRIVERCKVRIGDIRGNKWNPKSHPRVQQERLKAVLDKFGVVGDLIAFKDDDGEYTLFDGHARQSLDPDQEWMVAFTDLSRQEIDELVLYFDPLAALARQEADKTAALMAGLDVQERALREMLEEQAQSLGFAFGKSGKGAEDPGPQLDRASELQEKWGVCSGDLWVIESKTAKGEHRVVCGDCMDRSVVERVMQGERADCTVTDPPYGVGIDYGSFEDSPENVRALIAKVMPIIFENLPAAFTPGIPAMWDYPKPAWLGTWVHPAPIGSCPWGFVGNNPILFYGADPYLKAGKGRRPDSVVMASDRQGESSHPTSKPLKVWEWLVERLTPESGMLVFDSFLGSGTTLVACERLGRLGRGVEIEPKYVAVTLERLQGLGLEPKRLE